MKRYVFIRRNKKIAIGFELNIYFTIQEIFNRIINILKFDNSIFKK